MKEHLMAKTIGDGKKGQDPWRTLPGDALVDEKIPGMQADLSDSVSQWIPERTEKRFDFGRAPAELQALQGKYTHSYVDPETKRLSIMGLQQPGASKYDVWTAHYNLDPASGQYVLDSTEEQKMESTFSKLAKTIGPVLAVGAAGALAAGAAGAAGGGGAGGAAGAGAGSSSGLGALGHGAWLGDGFASGIGAWDAAATGIGALGKGGAGTGLFGGLSDVFTKAGGGAMNAKNWIDLIGLGVSAYGLAKQTAPEAPDMSGVNDAASRNAAIAERQQGLAEKQYADQMAIFEQFKPMLMEQIALSVAEQKKSIERGDDQWASYTSTWRPLENTLAQRTADLANPARVEQEAQRAASDTAGKFDLARTETRRSLEMAGASPEKIAAMEAAGRLNEAKSVGGVMSTARRQTETQQMGLLDNATRFGRNMPSTGLQVAGLAGSQGQAASGGVGNMQGSLANATQAASPLFNSAIAANNAYGNLFSTSAQAQYRSEMDKYNATIGALVGAANLYGRHFGPKE